MADEFTVNNAPDGTRSLDVPPEAVGIVLFLMVQSVHDALVAVIRDLGEKGLIDPSDYLLPEGVVFDLLSGK